MDSITQTTDYIYSDQLALFGRQDVVGFGVVYQACSFKYYGEHIQTFWELNGVVYHNIQMTVSPDTKRYTAEVEYLQTHKDQAKKMELRQFRYIFFIDKRWEQKCCLKQLPYPKHYKENNK